MYKWDNYRIELYGAFRGWGVRESQQGCSSDGLGNVEKMVKKYTKFKKMVSFKRRSLKNGQTQKHYKPKMVYKTNK